MSKSEGEGGLDKALGIVTILATVGATFSSKSGAYDATQILFAVPVCAVAWVLAAEHSDASPAKIKRSVFKSGILLAAIVVVNGWFTGTYVTSAKDGPNTVPVWTGFFVSESGRMRVDSEYCHDSPKPCAWPPTWRNLLANEATSPERPYEYWSPWSILPVKAVGTALLAAITALVSYTVLLAGYAVTALRRPAPSTGDG